MTPEVASNMDVDVYDVNDNDIYNYSSPRDLFQKVLNDSGLPSNAEISPGSYLICGWFAVSPHQLKLNLEVKSGELDLSKSAQNLKTVFAPP